MTVQRSEALDVPILDGGLMDILLPPNVIQSMLKYTNINTSDAKDKKILKAAVTYLLRTIMIYMTSFNTPAMQAFGLKSTSTFNKTHRHDQALNPSSIHPDGPLRRRFRCYILLSVILPFFYELAQWKLSTLESESYRESTTDDDNGATTSQQQQRVAYKRQISLLKLLLRVTSLIVPPMQLYHYVSYILHRGSTPTPSLSMNLCGIEYSAMDTLGEEERKRSVNFLYAYRRIWYEEFLLTMRLLPLDIWKSLPRGMMVAYRRFITNMKSCLSQSKMLLMDKTSAGDHTNKRNDSRYVEQACEICYSTPISIPYKTSCGHWYCYACLRTLVADDLNYHCIGCGQKILSSRPFR